MTALAPVPHREARRAADAARHRRHRARRRNGLVLRRIEVDEHALAEMLIASGRLNEVQALDPKAQEQALSAIVADIILRWRHSMTR